MGIENQVMTFRMQPENVLFIEGAHQNWFPFLSRSAVINLVITWCRVYSAQEKVNLPQDMAQRILCIKLYTNTTAQEKPHPRKAIRQQREEQTA